ncbi:MFS transporter [Halomonas sp. PAMB 3232]|uniref:MFS transporter n=1 Tax=Halomonas sp. PAMB 3232 TaxID=3075221 RepID=UPI0028985AD9|nr:MFS transporter [Halomonas sp. PAMB 3232]WNL39335.1 MFS transporter [Halomonas sp. PAMB 3232]
MEQQARWWAVIAVMSGIFLLVTAEQLPIGLLSQVALDLGVTEGTAGLMVTVPGVVAALSAPLLPVAVGRLDRRVMLTGLMIIMTLGSVLSAMAESFGLLLAARALIGMSIGGFWAIAGSIAPRLVPEEKVARAMTIIFGGVTAASVLGVPLGTLLGDISSWRWVFGGLGAFSLLTAGLIWLWLPTLPPREPVRLGMLFQQVFNRGVRVAVLTTACVVVGHFVAYTFISPILQNISGIEQRNVSTLLLLYGAAGLIGNVVAGMKAARNPYAAVLAIPVLLLLVVASFPLLGTRPVSGVLLLMVWGAIFGSISVSIQTWILRTAPNTEAATALMAFVFNMSIGLGALIGGRVVDATSLPTTMWAAAALFLVGVVLVGRTPSRLVNGGRIR